MGKTTVVGSLARVWARDGKRVLAVDADPAAHLHTMLGIPDESLPGPISEEVDLIEERTGARPGAVSAPFYRLNPRVDDIPGRYSAAGADGVRLMVLGTIRAAGSGCFCPENAVLRGLLEHVVLERDEFVLVDMEAGLEQFGRATCRGVDLLLVVVGPSARSVDTAHRVAQLASEMGVEKTFVVANGVRGDVETEAVRRLLSERSLELFHALPYSETVARADIDGSSPFQGDGSQEWESHVRQLSNKILSQVG